MYFVQGILGLSRLAKDFFVKDELGLDPAQASLIFSASSVPWLVKPLWGFISDSIPLFGYRRKSYLALCGGIGALAGLSLWGVVDDVPAPPPRSRSVPSPPPLPTSSSTRRRRESARRVAALSGSLQSLCWGSVAIGGIASAYFSGSLIEEYGTRYVFGVTALFPLLIAGAALLVDEAKIESGAPRGVDEGVRGRDVARTDADMETRVETITALASTSDERLSVGTQLLALGKTRWSVGNQRRIWAPTACVFLWQATPNPGTAMFYFTTNELGFTPEFLGRVALARSAAALVGVGLYNTYLKRVPLKKMFLWSAVLGTALGPRAAHPRQRIQPRARHQRPVLQSWRHRRAHRVGRGELSAGARAGGARVPRGRRGDALRRAHVRVQRGGGGERRAWRRAHQSARGHRG